MRQDVSNDTLLFSQVKTILLQLVAKDLHTKYRFIAYH